MLISFCSMLKYIAILTTLCGLSFQLTTPMPKSAAELYLIRFGYVSIKDEGTPMVGRSKAVSPKVMSDGLKLFQGKNGLPVTGVLDDATLKKFKQPRCGVKDIMGRSAFGHWKDKDLKYKFVGPMTRHLPQKAVREAIRAAFGYWEQVTPLTFKEVFDEENAHFILKFGRYDHGDDFPFDGPDGTLAHAFFPSDGRIHFDSDETFTEDNERGYNLRIVAAHEIGHAIGLPHSYDQGALMAPFYAGYTEREIPLLNEDDIRGIQRLYGARQNFTSSTTEKSTKARRFTRLTISPTTTTEPTIEPTTESTIEPTTESTIEPTTESTIEPTTESTIEPTTESTIEPTTESTIEPTTITTNEPSTTITTTEEPEEQITTDEPIIPTKKLSFRTDPQWHKVTYQTDQPDICSDTTKVSCVFMGKDGHMYLIVKYQDKQWVYHNVLTSSRITAGWPHDLQYFFKSATIPMIDTVVYISRARQFYLFSGTKVLIFNEFGNFDRQVETGKEVIYALNLVEDKTIAVTKGDATWEFNPHSLEFKSSKSISDIFPGIPAGVESAAEDFPWAQDMTYIYFFKGREYYKYHAVSKRRESTGMLGDSFFGCKQYSVPKLY